jgi:hypothetical protein
MESSKLTKSTSINQIEENDDDTKINTTSNNNINETKKEPKSKKENKKEKSPEKEEIKQESKKKEEDDDDVPMRSVKRSNSIKLYKKHKKDKDKKNSSRKENDIEIKGKAGDIFDISDYKKKKKNKNINKKVSFPEDFVTIIDIESYKKFNEENTCKDPFENIEIINGHINFIKKDDDESDGKARVQCSCAIF